MEHQGWGGDDIIKDIWEVLVWSRSKAPLLGRARGEGTECNRNFFLYTFRLTEGRAMSSKACLGLATNPLVPAMGGSTSCTG